MRRQISHVPVQSATVSPEPLELAEHAAVSDGAGREPDLVGNLIKCEGHASVLLSEKQHTPKTALVCHAADGRDAHVLRRVQASRFTKVQKYQGATL